MAKSRSKSPKWLIGALVTSLAVGAGYGGYRMFGSGRDDVDRGSRQTYSQDRGGGRDTPAQEWLERASGQQSAPQPQRQEERSKSPLSFPQSLFGGSEQSRQSPQRQMTQRSGQSQKSPSKYAKKSKKRGYKTASWKKNSKKKKKSGKKHRHSSKYAKSHHKKSKFAKKYKSKKNKKLAQKKKKSNKKLASYKREQARQR